MTTETQDPVTTQVEAPSAPDTSSAAPQASPSAETGTDAAQAGAGSEAKQSPPSEARVDGKDQPKSLTPPIPVASNTQSTDKPEAVDPEAFKRLRDEKSTWGRQQADLRKQAEGMRAQLAQLQQEREKNAQLAQQQKLALHDFRHPDHASKFQPILAKADIVRQQLARLNASKAPDGFTPEQAAMWQESQRSAIMSSLSEDEQGALEKFQIHEQEFRRKLSLNPSQTLHEFVTPMVQQILQQERAQMAAQAEVQRDLSDPNTGAILEKYREPMSEMIAKLGNTDEAYEVAKHHALVYSDNERVHAENARLKQQLAELGIKAGSAEAQQQLAKGRASITKDVAPRDTRTPYEIASEWAQKNRVDKSTPQFFSHLREIEAKQAPVRK